MATKKVNKNYQKGAQFERDMLIHLRGDPKKNTTGWLHQAMVRMFDGIFVPDVVLSSLKIFACRTPGSKGQGHVDVVCVITFGTKQVGVGVQCKTSKYMSKKEIKEEMEAITETGLISCFAIKKGSSFDWEYSPEEELQKRYLRGNRRTQ